ncbi:hypothetical protein CYLTODRAFT_425496 [Cylindrobasidium torrendii FP15055 ss-10]|uniref:Cytochrome b mRNA-processing protein 4 n=1 Tax=Cylindrobasidium torrendii FP15055 ss-10 TaxID=1314674 RepID=A0A0D7B0X1_9AGAR|nr:hypothetical protein CYLTODRAFT_425496 [Cylindrobasidium torrendii FP15055 ss-10]
MSAGYHGPPFPWGKVIFTFAGCIGLGYALMKTTVPTEEELYNRMAPDIQRKVDAARALRLAQLNQTQKQVDAQRAPEGDPDAQKPIWAEMQKR